MEFDYHHLTSCFPGGFIQLDLWGLGCASGLDLEQAQNPHESQYSMSEICFLRYGFNFLPQFGGNNTGVRNERTAVVNGVRSYSVTGYYCPSATRKNFHVITGAFVSLPSY
jgi:hypothetical protein